MLAHRDRTLRRSRRDAPVPPGHARARPRRPRRRVRAAKGAYVLWESGAPLQLVLLATGAELVATLEAARALADDGVGVRVVSVPCMEQLEAMEPADRDAIVATHVPARLAVEPGASMSWWRWVGDHGDVLGVDRFGASAPGAKVLEEYGFSAANIAARARALLEHGGRRMSERLEQLSALGQSVWVDFVSRDALNDGSLAKLIAERSVVGVTSNPTIFRAGDEQGQCLRRAARGALRRGSAPAAFWTMAKAGHHATRSTCSGPIYDSTGGARRLRLARGRPTARLRRADNVQRRDRTARDHRPART